MQPFDKRQPGTYPKLSVETLQSLRYSRNPLALELTGGGSCSSAAAAAAQSSTFQTAARCQSCQEIESSHPDSCCFTPASAHQRERAWRADVLTPSPLSEPRRRQRAGRAWPGFSTTQRHYQLILLLANTASSCYCHHPRQRVRGCTLRNHVNEYGHLLLKYLSVLKKC